MFATRWILYGSLVTAFIQTIASIVNVTSGTSGGLDETASILFVIVSSFSFSKDFFSTALFMQQAHFKEERLAVVRESEALRVQAMNWGVELPSVDNPMFSEPSADMEMQADVEAEAPIEQDLAFDDDLLHDDGDGDAKSENGSVSNAHVTSVAYADETFLIMKQQMEERGIVPAAYIPLPELQAEISEIEKAILTDQPYDDKRFEFLQACRERNPEWKAEQAELRRKWREEIGDYCAECLQIQRSFIPGSIYRDSIERLMEQGLSKLLAKR